MPTIVGGRRSIPTEICTHSDSPPPFTTQRFRPISAHSASTVRASEKCSISINRKSTMCTPACYRWSAYVTPKSPKGWHKNTILLFLPAKFKFCRKTSAAMFLFEKASRDKVVATSFLYLTVHRRIAGDVPIYLRFALQVTHPFRKHRFQPISLINASAVRASEKSSIITNTKSRKCFPSSHRWTLCINPKSPKGLLKTRIFTFYFSFHNYLSCR